jgi:small subunit ribosomal protein S2
MTEPTIAAAEPEVAPPPPPPPPPPVQPAPSFVAAADLPSVSLKQLIEAGVHFGHQTNRWNPKMSPFIYGARNGIHIVDLDQTVVLFKRAIAAVSQAVARGGQVLFVGTKRQAQEVILEEATRAGQFHVTGRWLGGTLTNFRTIKHGIERLKQLEQMEEDGSIDTLSKKEGLGLRREKERLTKYLGGIKDLNGPPAILFVVDPAHEHIAVSEANKLQIPVAGLTDTNCNPDQISLIIPGNDDAIRAIKLVAGAIADACIYGRSRRREMQASAPREEGSAHGVQVEFARGRRRPSLPPPPDAGDSGRDEA